MSLSLLVILTFHDDGGRLPDRPGDVAVLRLAGEEGPVVLATEHREDGPGSDGHAGGDLGGLGQRETAQVPAHARLRGACEQKKEKVCK